MVRAANQALETIPIAIEMIPIRSEIVLCIAQEATGHTPLNKLCLYYTAGVDTREVITAEAIGNMLLNAPVAPVPLRMPFARMARSTTWT
jgi:hypothetical protein